MHVIFCAQDRPNYHAGGPNVWLRRLLPELRKSGITSTVLFITAPGPSPNRTALIQEGFECPQLVWPPYTEQKIHWILRALDQKRPDVFIPNLSVAAYLATRWAREAGIPTVGVLHSDDEFYRGVQDEFLFGNSEYQVTSVVCVSSFIEAAVLARRPNGPLVRRIPCGVPVPSRSATPPAKHLRLAYVGRFYEKQKRISEVGFAMCRAARELPGTECLIFGEGPDRQALENVLATHGRGLPVYLVGAVDNTQIQEALLDCQAIVLLSDYEGIPIALMEAMACGVVPICSRVRSGIPELVEDGVTGLLVGDRGDSFVRAVKRLADEPGLWERLSKAARAKIEAEYSNGVCSARWSALLDELHQNAGPRRLLRIPRRLHLPPVHPGLAHEDNRRLPLHGRLLRKSRRLAVRMKGHFFGASQDS